MIRAPMPALTGHGLVLADGPCSSCLAAQRLLVKMFNGELNLAVKHLNRRPNNPIERD